MKIRCLPCLLAGAAIGIVVLFSIYLYTSSLEPKESNVIIDESISMEELELKSSAFEHNGKIPSKYTCDGENISPALSISGVDSGAKSLALIMDDPDIPKGINEENVWDHWIVFNISTDTISIAEDSEPSGIAGIGTSGKVGYHGPCPPDREHRYIFMLYALDDQLNLKEGATKQMVKDAMAGHILQKAELIGLYDRNKKQ